MCADTLHRCCAQAGRPGLSVSNNPRSAGIGRPLKKGDRVRFIGHASAPASAVSTASGMPVPSSLFGIGGLRSSSAHGKAAAAASSSHRGPFYNCPGQVVLAFDTTPGKVGVRFDYAVSGGTSLGNLCEGSMGYWCNVSDLRLEGSGKAEEREGAAIDALFDVAEEEAAKGPVIIYLKVRCHLGGRRRGRAPLLAGTPVSSPVCPSGAPLHHIPQLLAYYSTSDPVAVSAQYNILPQQVSGPNCRRQGTVPTYLRSLLGLPLRQCSRRLGRHCLLTCATFLWARYASRCGAAFPCFFLRQK